MSFWQLILDNPLWAQWALVIVGILTMFVIAWQAVETKRAAQASERAIGIMERQTKATEDSAKATQDSVTAIREQIGLMERQTEATEIAANAAKVSADAVISSERALVVPYGFVSPRGLPHFSQKPVQVIEMSVQLRNCGRTPAWFKEWVCRPLIADTSDISKLLDYGSPSTSPQGTPFPPGEIETFYVDDLRIEVPIEISDFRTGKKQLYVYGFMKYEDMFGRGAHESYFCFHYYYERDSRGMFVEGWAVEPLEANRYT